MARREMTKTERAARDAMRPYVRDGHMSQGEVNKTIRNGLAMVERKVREHYAPDQTFYWAGGISKTREKYEAAVEGSVTRRMWRGRLMAAEMYAAVYAVVREERGDTDVSIDQAVEVMATVRDTAREVCEEADAARPAVRPVAV